jgi:hypothetical protein
MDMGLGNSVNQHWHLTSSKHMSSFKTDSSECQGDSIEI